MTSQRAHAYARVIRSLDDSGPAELLPRERQRVRNAADALLFCREPRADIEASLAVADLLELHDHLVGTGRWTRQRAEQLTDDIWACGPGLLAA